MSMIPLSSTSRTAMPSTRGARARPATPAASARSVAGCPAEGTASSARRAEMEVLLRRWARKRSQWRVPMCAGEEAVVDGGYVGEGAADVDDEAGGRAGGVELRYGDRGG